MAKSRLTKKEVERLHDLQTMRMNFCDLGKWDRNTYNMCAAQRECEDEICRLRAKRDNRIWL